MLNAIKNLDKGNIESIDENMLYGLMTWKTGFSNNFGICMYINQNFYFVNKQILLGFLSLKVCKGICKYPKSTKVNTDKYDLIVSYLINHYNYGKNDIESLKPIIYHILSTKSELEQFALEFGLDNKERKKLGLDVLKFTIPKIQKNTSQSKSLFYL